MSFFGKIVTSVSFSEATICAPGGKSRPADHALIRMFSFAQDATGNMSVAVGMRLDAPPNG